MKILAPAKINLFLEITGKTKTGYHTLNTVFQAVSLYDEITITDERHHEIDFTCNWSGVGVSYSSPVEENLCYRAASALKAYLKEKRGAKIKLIKKIPVGAGLGGGSSDAAAVLRGLLKFWNREIDNNSLNRIAVELGADVPFFLYGGCCFAEGIGERLFPLRTEWDEKPLNLLLVKPDISKSSGDIYRAYDKRAANKPATINDTSKIKREKSVSLDNLEFVNNLEGVVFEKYPILETIKTNLKGLEAFVSLMSGGGTAIFGIFKAESIAKKAFLEIKKSGFNAWLVHTL
ncbi:MAG: 4-(cytidine 5'-diphospho)-2-C-methyl-D-erythritol kinase [Elusimicrobia bacterium RIFOXYA2_FULL_40_6]|nr:MAG: 4-(cytidine 5'-diphospho)-2-C-methyl-D-erythritol kinase [Elusimicrobia bacterium RIFOXYA2_FULL_40_6]